MASGGAESTPFAKQGAPWSGGSEGLILLRTSPPSLRRDALGLGTLGTLWGWALQGQSRVGHSRDTLGTLWGHSAAGPPETLWGWALQGHSVDGHSKDTLVGHSRDARGVDRARRRVPGEEKS